LKVSACIITYNQAPYIKKCIDGAISQKLSFDYEIVIGDDNSKDGTLEICNSYVEKYPDLIKLISRPSNIGMVGNWLQTISECSGDIIAICEGDDFWIDENKLQIQAEFLQQNPNYNISVHDVLYTNQTDDITDKRFTAPRFLGKPQNGFTLLDYIKNECLFHTSSFVIKKSMLKSFPEFLNSVMSLDQAIFILYCLDGLIHFINEPMSCYRVHSSGITNSVAHKNLLKSTNNQLTLFYELNKYTNYQFHELFSIRIRKLLFNKFKLLSGLYHLKNLVFKR
jgi:glycosyltransferase involved in cell wall biosynthesis